MNELNLGVCTEDVDGLIASYSEPKSNEDFIDAQGENKTPPEAEADDSQNPLTVKEITHAFDNLKEFLRIMEYDLNAERSLQVRRAIDRDTACYRLLYEEKKEASV
jgi:hypothetical protein